MERIHPLTTFRESQNPPLSQQQLAKRLKVSRPTVTRWENWSQKIDNSLVPRVSKETGIPWYLLRPDLAEMAGAAA